jgi:hypothetical protein
MHGRLSDFGDRGSRGFAQIVAAFFADPGLPFVNLLSAERIERIFRRHDNLFGCQTVYSTAVMVWSFLGQVLRDGKEASCQAAVARIIVHRQQHGESVPTNDTGDYCRARGKLSEPALRDLAVEVAEEVETQAPDEWLWKGRHAKLVDGFTFTMPDTPKNQEAYPQPSSQKPGLGFPMARVCALISLASACVLNLKIGPYSGKTTGESALLRELLDALSPQDLLVADRCFCSFFMLALLRVRNVDACVRMHQKRHVDFRRGKRLGRHDHRLVWNKPQRPLWMDEATWLALPDEMVLREIRYQIVEPGRRTQVFTVVTTLLDEQVYSKAEIAQLYGFRWNVELDIRSIKTHLNLNHVRCKSPGMVRRELWTTILAYNLIRTTAAAAASLHELTPREISFTATCQQVLAWWMLATNPAMAPGERERNCRQLLRQIARCRAAHRPGRIEPRQIKRRLETYKRMQHPRNLLRQRLLDKS